jgi:hypothetical protein
MGTKRQFVFWFNGGLAKSVSQGVTRAPREKMACLHDFDCLARVWIVLFPDSSTIAAWS